MKLKKQNKGALCEVPPFIITVSSKLLNQNLTVHISRSFQTHDFQDSRSHISQATVFYFRSFVSGYVHTRNRIQRVSRIRSAILVQGVILDRKLNVRAVWSMGNLVPETNTLV